MKAGLIRIRDQRDVAVPCVKKTETVLERTKGLLGSKDFKEGEGLLITPCNSVHTFFMRFAIDVVFLDKENSVVKVVRSMKPFRLAMALSASAVLELPAGDADRIGVVTGNYLLWEDA